VKHCDASDDIELGRSEKQLSRSGITRPTTSEVTIPFATLPSPTSSTSPAKLTSPSAVLFEERNNRWERDAIITIYKYNGFEFYESSLELFIDKFLKHDVDVWHALCELHKITQRDELAMFIFEDAKISDSRKQEIMNEVQANGVKWTPELRNKIKVGVLIWIDLLLDKLTYCRRFFTGARNGRLDFGIRIDAP
jgi:hypothetical protein